MWKTESSFKMHKALIKNYLIQLETNLIGRRMG